MKISIVVPNFNGGEFLGECLASIVSQLDVDKEIIVMDGGSTDLSLSIIQDYEPHLAHWESAPDGGPYHAVERGLNMASGDILCWINSDDIFLPGALKEVAQMFKQETDVQWLSGMHATFLEQSVIHAKGYPITDFFISDDTNYAFQLYRSHQHHEWSRSYILEEAPNGGYFLQQESTFWRKSLWESVGGFDHRFKLAADFWLWLRFLEEAPLIIVDRPFGCFRQTPGQRSVQERENYKTEALKVAEWSRLSDIKDADAGQEATSLIQTRRFTADSITLATSIAPVELNKQGYCIRTWLQQGCQVLSFNTQDEIERITAAGEEKLNGVEFVPVERTARDVTGKDQVYLGDILAYFKKEPPNRYLGIINSDIMIETHFDILGFARANCDGSQCVVSSRIDVENFLSKDGQVFMRGYDVCLFRQPHIADVPEDIEFAIGAPWWDYYLPHWFQQTVDTINYPRPIPFYHRQHTTNYPLDIWVHYGDHFLQHCYPDLAAAYKAVPDNAYRVEYLARIARQFSTRLYQTCATVSPQPWAEMPAYGSGFQPRSERIRLRMRQWADRAIVAEELLQSQAGSGS